MEYGALHTPGERMTSYRGLLRRLVTGAILSLLAALGYVFAMSLNPPAHRVTERFVKIDLTNLKPGEAVTRRWDGLPIVVLHRTEAQIADIAALASWRKYEGLHALVPEPEGVTPELRSLRQDYFVAYKVPGGGVPCSPQYAGADREQRTGLPYPVAFMELCRGTYFDAAGHLMYGSWPGPDLSVPPHRYLSDTLIEIGPSSSDPAYSFNARNRGFKHRSL